VSIENPPEILVARTGIEPVCELNKTTAESHCQELAASKPPQQDATLAEFRPQSSPIVFSGERSGPTVKRHKSNQGYGTPFTLIRACEQKFGRRVLWDLAASEANAKASLFFTEEDDALTKRWDILTPHDSDLCWLNPPFDDIAPWAEKCAREAARGARILLLTPASIGANWFRDHVHGKAHVFALNGRITFVGASDPYPKDCMISAFGIGAPAFSVWSWNTKEKA
jgi:phage N-6-adenine-methyltransferase